MKANTWKRISAGLVGLLAAGLVVAGNSDLEVEIGVGFDDNAFLAPSQPYFDQFSLTTIDPDPTSGWFVPAKLRGNWRASDADRRFVVEYRARADIYGDSDTSNADESFARLAPGIEWVTGRSGRRENTVAVRPFFLFNEEVFFDRDTGLDFQSPGGDLSDRYSYTAFGAEFELERRTHKRIEFGLEGLYEARDYEDVSGASSLDHDRFRLGVDVEFDLSRAVNLYLDYTWQMRDYDERTSRDLTGSALTTNPPIEYIYHFMGATGRFKMTKHWTLYADFDHQIRDDEFLGYNDYTQDSYRLRSIHKFGKWRLRAAVRSWERSYDRAFIFDNDVNPADSSSNPNKDYETLDVDLSLTRKLTPSLSLEGELDYRDQETADPRYTYERLRTILRLSWRL